MSQSDLMSYAEYGSKEYPVPYMYHFSSGDQHLYFFGSSHTYNPNDEQISKLEAFWAEFEAITKGMQRKVLVEGGMRLVLNSKKEAIETGGEIQYTALLAAQSGIPVESPEPPASHWFQILASRFSKDAVAYYDFARICYQWNQKNVRPAFESYVSNFLESDTRNSGWSDYDFSLEHMKKIHYELFHTVFKEDDKQFFYDIINPTTSFSVINEVSHADDEGIRDTYIFLEIKRHLEEGKSLFIIYGQQHAVILEAALKKLMA
ncbi:MAG: hypothetical protein HZB11_02310 [Candidatus Yonathbacteria bacterium]|nr:hypothetical protein [Candidatus Yonathbacteria bacterium]